MNVISACSYESASEDFCNILEKCKCGMTHVVIGLQHGGN